ncbi:alpha/beta fold hydrolase [Micromonospora endolithica]|uniref:Alpha/beta hydrolase n=1 Tax=Micromonospora endolithica TaxID=230091 RepID=A0A3A9ZJL0_9ACTN|nr:alpha/beta hydrolase [Micromonospora endolithica]RKN47526.1 alpha/beta hydrolase [Micromonospora endolithica]TWJ21165.1 pimeloyl-ACP methyl ester carboxylesterase [Micromonospora endolithica]
MKPTIVLVHGAFAESASWNGVIGRLQAAGHRTIAAGNPLRTLTGDAAAVSDLLATITGPIVLVGHSYGGAVASNAAVGNDNVKALVYVAAFAPDKGENVPDLTGKFPGATLGDHLYEVPLADGTTDLYVRPECYHELFAADLPFDQSDLAAATQRPLNTNALTEGSAEPAWKTVPSWFIFPEQDLTIPLETFRFMAERANARESIEVSGASHALPASRPQAVADVILRAAAAV